MTTSKSEESQLNLFCSLVVPPEIVPGVLLKAALPIGSKFKTCDYESHTPGKLPSCKVLDKKIVNGDTFFFLRFVEFFLYPYPWVCIGMEVIFHGRKVITNWINKSQAASKNSFVETILRNIVIETFS